MGHGPLEAEPAVVVRATFQYDHRGTGPLGDGGGVALNEIVGRTSVGVGVNAAGIKTDSLGEILDGGVNTFLELGPGSVLSGLLRRIDRDAKAVTLGTVAEVEAFLGQ